MAFEWKLLLDAFKISTRCLLGIAFACGFVLIAPGGLIEWFGLAAHIQQYHSYLSAAFIAASALLLASAVFVTAAWARKHYSSYMALRRARACLHKLTPEEQGIIRGYLETNTKTRILPCNSGVVGGLERYRIINQSAEAGRDSAFPFNINDWAWDYLHDHPELVGLTDSQLRITPKIRVA